MIQAFELRKGNTVKYGNTLGKVSQILWNRVEIETNDNGNVNYLECEYNELEAVLVTPVELEHCGFVKHERFPHRDVFHLKNHDFIINILRDTSEISFGLDGTVALIRKGEIFLHQLQNLFFFLTHQELNYRA